VNARVAVSTGGWVERPILDVLDAFAAAGVEAVEIGTPPRHFDPMQREGIGAVRERLARLGIRAVSIHAPFGGLLDLAEPNAHHRNAAIGAILEAARALAELGGGLIVVHPSDLERASLDADRAVERCIDALGVLVPQVHRLGLGLAVESPLPHLVGGSPGEFERILASLPEDVAVCLDTSHLWLGRHWERFLELAARRSLHLHASDNHGRHDDHLPPGDGVIPWDRVWSDLERAGFDGWTVLELSAPEGPIEPYVERARRADVVVRGLSVARGVPTGGT
jgi:sugar phosphate isomerase/epimerase